MSGTSTRWTPPAAFDEAGERLNAFLATVDWEAYNAAGQTYLTWSFQALTDLTRYANELPDAEIQSIASEPYGPWTQAEHSPVWNPRGHALRQVGCMEWIVDNTRGNLDQLHVLGGDKLHDVGAAVVAQGIVDDDNVTDFLAGPWIRRGHPFPRHPRIRVGQFRIGGVR